MAETVLVTGGSGFIAGWIMRHLLEQGYAVRATLRDLSKAEAVRTAVAPEGTEDRIAFVQADLLADDGWDTAMAGCDYVIHAASPLGGGAPGDRYSLVPAARDGTLRVLKAAVGARVKRIVMTSAAATARPPLASRRVSDETVWASPDDRQFDAYRVSKILAEVSAWEFMASVEQTARFTTILPGAVFGPVLMRNQTGSVDIIGGLLRGRPAILPRLGVWITDVRDLADMHIRALTKPEAAGERFIVAGAFLWMAEMAGTLSC